MKPVAVVAVLVEAFRRAEPAVVGFRGGRTPRREVEQQGPGATMFLRRLLAAMQVLATVEIQRVVITLNQPVRRSDKIHVAFCLSSVYSMGLKPSPED